MRGYKEIFLERDSLILKNCHGGEKMLFFKRALAIIPELHRHVDERMESPQNFELILLGCLSFLTY